MQFRVVRNRSQCEVIARRPHRQAGFSLLEVVVAFAILALSLGLLIQIFTRAMNTTVLSGAYSRAATLAEARLNAVGVDIPLELGSYNGDTELGLNWRVVIEPFEPTDLPGEPIVDAFFVTSVVSWGDGTARNRQVSLSTLRLAATSDDPGLGSLEEAERLEALQEESDP